MDNSNYRKNPTSDNDVHQAPLSDDVQSLLNEYLGVPQDIQVLITDYLGTREKARRKRKPKKKK